MSEELKPCPFCGSEAVMEPWHGGAPTKQCISCVSENCEVAPIVTGETPEEAITNWNTRTPITAEQLEKGAEIILQTRVASRLGERWELSGLIAALKAMGMEVSDG